jgi:hypothetical protein
VSADAVKALVEARAMVAMGWTQGVYARDADGNDIEDCDDTRDAACWCASGALHLSGGTFGSHARSALVAAIETSDIAGWNDDPARTQEEVLAAFDKAIALVRATP